MQIFLIYDNKKFRFEYNDNENPHLQVKFLFSKLPKADPSDAEKEYILIWEEEVFQKEDSIDMQKYNNRDFVFIFLKKNSIKKALNSEDQKTKESKKPQINSNMNISTNNYNMTMAQMIKKLTNAKEEINIAPKKKNNNQNIILNEPSSHRRLYIDPAILEEYDIDSDFDYPDVYEEDYESDVIMVGNGNANQLNQMILDESENSASDMDVSMNASNLEVDENHLSQLVSMGFNAEMSELALRRCCNRIDLAIEFLMFIG